VKSQIKGTLILRRKGRYFKVFTTRRLGDNLWTFECRDIESKRRQVFKYQLLGMLEAMDAAASKLKDPKDILLIDFDKQGKWSIMTKDQIEKALKGH